MIDLEETDGGDRRARAGTAQISPQRHLGIHAG